MSLLNQFVLFAEYNKLMNQRMMESASQLSGENLKADRGAFFKSVLGTLNHILVADIIWLKRFSTNPASNISLEYINQLSHPTSLEAILFDDLNDLKTESMKMNSRRMPQDQVSAGHLLPVLAESNIQLPRVAMTIIEIPDNSSNTRTS